MSVGLWNLEQILRKNFFKNIWNQKTPASRVYSSFSGGVACPILRYSIFDPLPFVGKDIKENEKISLKFIYMITRKHPLRGCILAPPEGLRAPELPRFWYTQLGYTSPKTLDMAMLPWNYAEGQPQGDDPKCIIVIAETYATMFISNIFAFDWLLV